MSDEEPHVLCKCCKEKIYKGVSIFLVLLGLTAVGVATFLPPYIDSALKSALQDQVTLTKADYEQNTDKFALWSDPTSENAVPLYYHVTVYNVTNPHAVLNGAKPVLQEVGPYVYRDMKHYFNFTFGADAQGRSTLKYHIYEYFLFQRDMTDAALDPDRDRVYSLNMAYQAMVPRGFKSSDPLGPLYPMGVFYYNHTDFYRLWGSGTHTINEVLFGFEDPEMALASAIFGPTVVPPRYPGVVGNDTSMAEASADITATHPGYTIYTGETPHEQLLRTYAQWEDMTYVTSQYPPDGLAPKRPTWLTPDAQRVAGTDGTQFRQYIEKGMGVEVFVDELYRAAPLINAPATDDFYVESLEVKGITLYRFTMPPSVTLNASVEPANAAYSMFGPDGLSNLTTPRGANIFVSKPHFQDGDPRLLANLTGVSAPVRELHDTYVDVEPLTGSVFHAAKRLQANVLLAPWFSDFEWWTPHVPQLYLPVFWAEQNGVIPDHLANEFVGAVYVAQNLSLYLKWIGFFGGAFLIVVGFVMIFTAPGHFPTSGTRTINSYGAADSRANTAPITAQAPYDAMDDDDGRHGDRPIPDT